MNRFMLTIPLAAILLVNCSETTPQTMVGTLERDRIEIKVETNEPILEIGVSDGQTVTAGTLILSQDPARAAATLSQQQANRHQALARLAELRRGPRPEVINETRARLQAARAITANTAAELQRARDVFERGLSSQAILDNAEVRWKTAVAEQQAVTDSLEAQLNGTTVEELDQAEAALEAADAAVAQAQLTLERTRLVAPSGGMIDKVLYQVGERPSPGTTVAVLLAQSRVFARIYVPENLRARIQPGVTLTVRIDGVPEDMQGTVRWVSSDASFTPYFALTEHDRSRLTYLAEIDLADAGDLPSGLPLVVIPPPNNTASP